MNVRLTARGLFLVLLVTTSVLLSMQAQSSPPAETLATLYNNLADASTEEQGRIAEGAVWEYWFNQSPTKALRAKLDAGRERLRAYDFEAAEAIFTEVIEDAPAYAEGYNQRAFARFLRQNYEGSLSDLEKTLVLEPRHFGALSGKYQILLIQNRRSVALTALQAAVSLHPWLKERSALPENLWPRSFQRASTARIGYLKFVYRRVFLVRWFYLYLVLPYKLV